jgi:hypothetical protein
MVYAQMLDDVTKIKIVVLQLTKGYQVCGCAQAQGKWFLSVEYQHPCAGNRGYTARTRRKLKTEVCGGKRGL